VQVNLAYRRFCKLGFEEAAPDHSAFSRARDERFRGGDVFRRVFERLVEALYRASKLDCDVCPLKPQCRPKGPSRKIPRDIHEHTQDVARSFAGTEAFEKSRREAKKDRDAVRTFEAHPQARSASTARPARRPG
jgi:hypothetical protein